MRHRFDLQVALFDEERFIESDASNPFEDTQQPGGPEVAGRRRESPGRAVRAGWDLLVVEEAHHLVRHEEEVSLEYSLVEQLAENDSRASCC